MCTVNGNSSLFRAEEAPSGSTFAHFLLWYCKTPYLETIECLWLVVSHDLRAVHVYTYFCVCPCSPVYCTVVYYYEYCSGTHSVFRVEIRVISWNMRAKCHSCNKVQWAISSKMSLDEIQNFIIKCVDNCNHACFILLCVPDYDNEKILLLLFTVISTVAFGATANVICSMSYPEGVPTSSWPHVVPTSSWPHVVPTSSWPHVVSTSSCPQGVLL